MYPISLNLAIVPTLLVGKGEALIKREKKLRDAGAANLVISDSFSFALLANATVVMVVGLSHEESKVIATAVRAAGKLVNVEDVNDLCDFYFTANVKRGDLTIAVSTNGASPTLAKRVRDKIAAIFGAEWAEHTNELKQERDRLRAEGKNMQQVADASDAYLSKKGWLEDAA